MRTTAARFAVAGILLTALLALGGADAAPAPEDDTPSALQPAPANADGDAERDQEREERRRRRAKREEYIHDDSGQRFLAPPKWDWHDPPTHFKVNRLCYPPDARTYMPCAILRIKPLDEGVTFPMIVEYAEYRLNKLIDVDDVLEDEPIELHFENQGGHVLHVKGETEGLPVECRQIVYLRGEWFTVVACCGLQRNFDEFIRDFDDLIQSISFGHTEE